MHISAGIASAGSPPRIIMSKSRDNTLNGNTILQDDDAIGAITFCPADGVDRNSISAEIVATVDGTPGENDAPGRLSFLTTVDGANTTTERMRIDNSGRMQLNMSTFGSSVSASVTGFEIHKNGSSPFIQHGTAGTGTATMYNFFNANGAVGSISGKW